jgi:competence protein ComEA
MSANDFIKKHAYFLLGTACIIIAGIIFIASRETENIHNEPANNDVFFHAANNEPPAEFSSETPATLIIHITGAVNSPGVFELPRGARVIDALELAGGPTSYADTNRVNLAEFLQDAMQIIIPAEGQELDAVFIFSETHTPAGGNSGGIININTATLSELQTLSGIGPVLAQNIIDFREAHGNFSSVDELIHVPRIGEATLERLRPNITVD